jgi:hypothetical protein
LPKDLPQSIHERVSPEGWKYRPEGCRAGLVRFQESFGTFLPIFISENSRKLSYVFRDPRGERFLAHSFDTLLSPCFFVMKVPYTDDEVVV